MIDCFTKPESLADCLLVSLQNEKNNEKSGLHIKRIEIAILECDLYDWLSQQSHANRIFWQERERSFSVAAIGQCISYGPSSHSSFREASEVAELLLCHSDSDVKFFGGHSFSAESMDSSWGALGYFLLTVPRFEIVNRNGVFSFVLNYLSSEYGEHFCKEIECEFNNISWGVTDTASISLENPLDDTDKQLWIDSVAAFIKKINGSVKKLVVGRTDRSILAKDIDPVLLLKKVSQDNVSTFNFCFSPSCNFGFLGCSPESLFYKKGRSIWSEAIAGTRLINDTRAEPLSESQKNIVEQQFVHNDILQQLYSLCTEVFVLKNMEILRLRKLEHLRSNFKGILAPQKSIADIIESLHPSAAICGYPREKSIGLLSEYEAVKRGWFSAPVGWIGRDAAEFSVGIRSARISGNELTAFAAAGIVEASVPEMEYIEISQKMSQYFSP